jgi:PTS system nitrogen regulatory IIA component|tara:strand:- start:378 stop:854 length:477 start_codon:yes stop_codon:yes gene_type:complete
MADITALHEYLDARLIHVNSDVSSPKKLLQEMARLLFIPLQESGQECREKDVYHALLEREKLGNTGIGNGVALPHSRFHHAEQAIIAIITLKQAIDYDSSDGERVDIAFGLIVPQEATQEHLQILANIAGMMSKQDNKDHLVSATSAEQAIAIIKAQA